MKNIIQFTLFILFVTICCNMNFAQNRFVSTTGADAANDCSSASTPCKTIAKAATSAIAGDTIFVAAGNYILNGTLDLDKSNICLTAQNSASKPVIMSNDSVMIEVSAENVSISNFVINMGLTASTGLKGIVGVSNIDGLHILGNEFYSTNQGDLFSPGMIFSAYAILLSVPNQTETKVTILNNKISVLDSTNDVFGRGIGIGFNSLAGQAYGPGGIIANNQINAFYPAQCISVSSDLVFSSNELNGLTMVGYTENGKTVKIDSNVFNAVESKYAVRLFTMIDVRANQYGNIVISHNLFKNYENFAVASMASKNVALVGNTFSPLPTADKFVSIMANTKMQTSSIQNNTYPNEISIQGNIFNPGASNGGTAIWIADHYGAVTPAFDTIVIGGNVEGLKNVFNTDLGNYIRLDSMMGSSDQVEIWNPSGTGNDTPPSTMKPISQNVYALAVNNHYIFTTVNEIETKNIDLLDNSNLGKVILGYVSSVGIQENIAAPVASLFPNPATDNLNILINNKNFADVKIIDVLGNIIYSSKIHAKTTLNIASYEKGVYFVKMNVDGKTFSSKFIKR